MPTSRPTLTGADALALSESLFAPSGNDRFGLELEWPLHRGTDVAVRPTAQDVEALNGVALSHGGRITFEPGGQVELSTAPAASMIDALAAVRAESAEIFERLRAAGFTWTDVAVDDRRSPQRILDKPRYRAMESYFTQQGGPGVWMMTNTTSLQVNVSHLAADPTFRWRVLGRITPLLVAVFSNSPGIDADGQRWACLRQAIWWHLDPGRSHPVSIDGPPAQAWLDYAMAAGVMFIQAPNPPAEPGLYPVAPGFSFGEWMREGHELGWPTADDLRAHMSTLFPPVRPRGWLELRVLDALDEPARTVATLSIAAACTVSGGRHILEAVGPTEHLWERAIRDGLADSEVAGAAAEFFDAVTSGLAEISPAEEHQSLFAEFRARYLDQGRCPGDDLPANYDLRTHSLVPASPA